MKQKICAILLFIALLATCCTGCAVADEQITETWVDYEAEFSDRDFDTSYDPDESTHIILKEDKTEINGVAARFNNGAVYILDEGTYILSGTLNNGMIIVNADKKDKVQLVLDGVTIHSDTCAPIYVAKADKVFVTTAKDTVNTLSNGGTFEPIDENNIDAVIFSKDDITLNGNGKLVISSPAGHGIVGKDSLTVTCGSYEINSAAHALDANDDICIADGTFALTSGKDGLHAENDEDAEYGFVYIQNGTFDITAEGDGISGSSNVQIENGTYRLTTGGGSKNGTKERSDSWGGFRSGGKQHSKSSNSSNTGSSSDSTSMKGIKAAANLHINNGNFVINSADDAVHSNGHITVWGGNFEIATGDDALHADNTLTVAEGTFNITESYEGLEGIHIDISGGNIALTANDDGINAAGGTDSSGFTGGRDGMFGGMHSGNSKGSIVISGGSLLITAYGDGIDANGTFDMTGGSLTVCGPIHGDTATLDYDIHAKITGGTFIGTGSTFMAQSFSDAQQGIVAVRVNGMPAGSKITLTTADGTEILAHTPHLDFAVVILSSPEIISGNTYTLSIGSVSGNVTAR